MISMKILFLLITLTPKIFMMLIKTTPETTVSSSGLAPITICNNTKENLSGFFLCQPYNCTKWISFSLCPENTEFTQELNFADSSLNCLDPSNKAMKRETVLVPIQDCKGQVKLGNTHFWCKFQELCWFDFNIAYEKAWNPESIFLNFQTRSIQYVDTELPSELSIEDPISIIEPTVGQVKNVAWSSPPLWNAITILVLLIFYIYLC